MTDRILLITDILMGAAHADQNLSGREGEMVRHLVGSLLGTGRVIPQEVELRIRGFQPAAFKLRETAAAFAADAKAGKRNLLELVCAVHDADEELDFDEDQYVRDLGAALGLAPEDYKDLVLDIEVETLRQSFAGLRAVPPKAPGA